MLTVALCCVAVTALAQRGFGGFGGRWVPFSIEPNAKYDGRFTFVRLQLSQRRAATTTRASPHGRTAHQIAEPSLMKIMNEVSYLTPRDETTNMLALEDPEIAKYPVAYIIEVGWWTMTDRKRSTFARTSSRAAS